MQQLRTAIAVIGAALMFGCGDAPEAPAEQRINKDGVLATCTEPGDIERPFMNYPGYDPEGCTRSDRMWDVSPSDPDDDNRSEIGTARQAITVGNGQLAATAVTVNGSSQVSGFTGACPRDLTWTTARPRVGDCLIPEVVSSLRWAVCPGCYSSLDLIYMRNRMKEAWDVWKFSTTSTCGNLTFNNSLPSTANSEMTAFATPDENYDNARIVVYPNDDLFVQGRAGIDKDFVVARTPIRNGIRYYSWQNMAIEVGHHTIESVKLPQCVDPTDPQLDLKKMRGYRWMLAHELGHAFGMPHMTDGIMRTGSSTPCSTQFSAAAQAPALTAPTAGQRLAVNSLTDSGGFSLWTPPPGVTCGNGTVISGFDDMAVVNF